MRQIERWLHQHIFKVGWLLSHNYETTTILYYTVFLPGVFLHELIYWLMAGVMNVRADRSIQWPEKQEIGNLQLTFIKLSPKANPLKRAIISATPLVAGLLVIWLIGVHIFQLETVMSLASSGQLEDVAKAINFLVSAPDFWLWFYISFTVANTMFPTIPKDIRGWWQIGGAAAVIVIALFILGIGQSFLSEISLSLAQILNSLSLTLLLTIGINVTMVLILGLIEYTIERVTGHSATFQKGKMITMTREEALQRKREEQEKRLAARSSPRRRVAAIDPASIYTFEFPIPGPPGQEPITKGVAAILGMDSGDKLPDTVEEGEIIETTATDSDRQRMLRLFPETDTTTDGDDDDEFNQPALPSGTSSSAAANDKQDTKQSEPRKKPTFGVREFNSLDIDASEDEDTQDDEADEKPLTRPLPKRPSISPVNRIGGKDAGRSSPIPKPVSRTEESIPAVDEDVVDKEKPEQIEDKPKTAASTAIDLSTMRRKSPVTDDSEDNEKQLSSNAKPSSTPTPYIDDEMVDDDKQEVETVSSSQLPTEKQRPLRSPVSKQEPQQSIPDDITIGEDEALSTPSFRQTSHFADRIKSPSDDEEPETALPFSRPFVKRDMPTFEDEEDEGDDDSLETTDSPFARPFAKSDLPSGAPAWRSKLGSMSDEEEADEDDEQLAFRRPRTSMFDSLNTKSDEPSKPQQKPAASDWRSKLASSSTTDDDGEDEDDEQLAFRRPRTSMFDSLNTKSDEPRKPEQKPVASDWRSKLGSSNSEDDDEDDEQLAFRRPRASMFDSLNTKSDEPRKPEQKPVASDWRSKLGSSNTEDDDEDDEQLAFRRPRTSMFDSLNAKPDESEQPKQKPAASDWRSNLGSMTDDEEVDDDDEQLGGRSILSGLGRPQPNRPRSTTSGSGSHPAPKPSAKSGKSDWRSQLKSQDEGDDTEMDEAIYEPIEDEVLYEEDEEYEYIDDDDDEYYDEEY